MLLAVRAAVDPAALLLKEAKSFYGPGGSVKDKPNKMQDLRYDVSIDSSLLECFLISFPCLALKLAFSPVNTEPPGPKKV